MATKLTEEQKMDQINEAIKLLDVIEPLGGFAEPITEALAEQNFGLARMYSDAGYRKYLINEHNKAMKNVALRSATAVDIAFGKARILTLKELLVKGKRAFEEVQRIQALANKPKTHGK